MTVANPRLAILAGLSFVLVGGGLWSLRFGINFQFQPAVPWSTSLMLVFLYLGWLWLAGAGPPHSTRQARIALIPRTRLNAASLVCALVAATAVSLALLALLLMAYRVFPIPMAPLPA